MRLLLFDAAPELAGIAVIGGVAFFFVMAAVAFVAYKMLRRTLRFGFRVGVAVLLLAIGIAGTIFLVVRGTSDPPRRPNPNRSR